MIQRPASRRRERERELVTTGRKLNETHSRGLVCVARDFAISHKDVGYARAPPPHQTNRDIIRNVPLVCVCVCIGASRNISHTKVTRARRIAPGGKLTGVSPGVAIFSKLTNLRAPVNYPPPTMHCIHTHSIPHSTLSGSF